MIEEQQIKQIIKQGEIDDQYGIPITSYHIHNNIDAPFVPFSNIDSAPNTFCVATKTNGTTAVNVFTNGAPFNFTVTGVYLTSLDTTAGTSSVINNGVTIATIQKGTVVGAMVGATNLSTGTSAVYSIGNTFTVVSSSVGNATIFLTYTT